MSDSERRIQRIAIGFAIIAVAIAFLGVIVVATKYSESSPQANAQATRRVSATDLVKLKPETVEQVNDGIRVTDEALRKVLSLGRDDTITAISGRPVSHAYELRTVMLDLSLLRPRALFIELVRDREQVLERWELDGDLSAARRAAYTIK